MFSPDGRRLTWLVLLAAATLSPAVAAPPAGDLSAAVRLPQDREAEQLLSEAQTAAERGVSAQAVALLQQVLDGGADWTVVVDGSHRNARDEANRRIASLPAEGRAAYERHSGNAAQVALNEPRARGAPAGLLEVATRYRQTRAGSAALRQLAEWHTDSGRFHDAALAWQSLIEQSGNAEDTARRDPQAVFACCAALLLAGEPDAARDLWQRFEAVLEGRAVVPGGPSASERMAVLFAALSGRAHSPREPELPPGPDLPAALLPTSAHPVWEFAAPPDTVEPEGLERLLARFGESGVAPNCHGRPMVVDGALVVRTVDAVICLDTASGELRWRHAVDASDLTPSPGLSPADQLVERWLGDAALSAVTCDGEGVYLLAPQASRAPTGAPIASQDAVGAAPRRLVALDVRDGEPRWEVTADSLTLDPALQAGAPVLFQGPPTPHRGELYVLAEQGEALFLAVLAREEGSLKWSVRLGHVDHGIGRDDRRLAQHCPVAFSGGLACCPTGGGALVAVDLLSRRVRWGVRYPRESVRPQDPETTQGSAAPRQVLWGSGWSDLFVAASNGRVLLGSPESESLWGFDAQSGAVVWRQPRGTAQYVAGVFGDVLVVVDRDSATAFRVADGELRWATPTDEPAGRGFATATHYVLPLLHGGVAAVDIARGTLMRTYPRAGPPTLLEWPEDPANGVTWRPRSLIWTDGGVIEQTADGVRRLNSLQAERRAAEQAVAIANPPSAPQIADLVALARESGDFEAAADHAERRRQLLSGAQADEARRELLEVLLWAWDQPQPDAGLAGRLESLATEGRERLLCRYAAWRHVSADAPHDLVNASFALLDLLDESCFGVVDGGARRVRLDLLVASRLTSARAALEAPEGVDFDRAIEAALATRLAGQGGLAAAEWAERVAGLPAGRRLTLGLAPQWSSVRGFLQRQLRLESLSHEADPTVAASALRQLAAVFESHQDHDDAAGAYRRLRDEFVDVRLSDGATVAEVLSRLPSDSPIRRRIEGDIPSVWPMRQPTVSVRPWPEGAIYFIPVRVEAERGGLFDRLNVAVDRLGGTVRFSGAGLHRPWALQLPRSGSLLRSAQIAPELRRGWGFGQMLVLQVGADVFGIAPFDAVGEPSATLVWPSPGERIAATDAALVRETIVQTIAPRRRLVEFDSGRQRTDPLGHVVGQVGPVRAGYFCVLERGMLVARDTATGEELWRRRGLPAGVRCAGDDRHVVISDLYRDEVRVLNAFDGSVLRTGPAGYAVDQVLQTSGARLLRESAGSPVAGRSPPYQIELLDLTTGQPVWSAEFQAGSACLPIDPAVCGVLEPEGMLHLVRLADGVALASHRVEVPETVTRIVSLYDADTAFVVVSGPRTDAALEAATPAAGLQTNEGRRRAIVNGAWHALDRHTGALRWSRTLDNASLPLDQALDVPLLVCNEHTYPADRIGQGVPIQRVRCFDKRTGELVYDGVHDARHNYFIVERDESAGWVEVRLPGEVVRFDYSDAAP